MSPFDLDSNKNGMTLIVKTITRLTVGLIVLYGIHIALMGHNTPGGGFAGGVIIALSFVNLLLAYGKEMALKRLCYNCALSLLSIAVSVFLVVALLGLIKGRFFLNFFGVHGFSYDLFNTGIIPLCDMAICIEVGMGLFAIFIVLVFFKITGKVTEEEE